MKSNQITNGKLYIHIGTHKTGTTSIQQALRKNKNSAISYLEVYPKEWWFKALLFCNRRFQKIRPYRWWYKGLLNGTNTVKEIIRESVESHPITIISYEELSGYWPSGYSDTKERANVLQWLTEELNPTIIIYIRNRDEFIESIWKQSIRQGYKFTLEEFKETHKNGFNWSNLVFQYSIRFNKVIVRPYKGNTLEDFSRQLNINLDTSIYANKSLGPKTNKIIQKIFPHIGNRSRILTNKILRGKS